MFKCILDKIYPFILIFCFIFIYFLKFSFIAFSGVVFFAVLKKYINNENQYLFGFSIVGYLIVCVIAFFVMMILLSLLLLFITLNTMKKNNMQVSIQNLKTTFLDLLQGKHK